MSKKDDKYILVASKYPDKLSEKVNILLRDGWILHGTTNSVVEEEWGHFQKRGESVVFSQALIRL